MRQFELMDTTPLPGRIKPHPRFNPTGMAANPYEWKHLQDQLACLYGHLINIRHVNALMRSINHLFRLLITDGGVLMTIELTDQIVSRNYGATRARAEGTITALGLALRCTAVDAKHVREKLESGGYQTVLPDVSPGGESHFVLSRALEQETHRHRVYMRASRTKPDRNDLGRSHTPVDKNATGPEGSRKVPRNKTDDNTEKKAADKGKGGLPRVGEDSAPLPRDSTQEAGQRGPLQDLLQRGAEGPLRKNDRGEKDFVSSIQASDG